MKREILFRGKRVDNGEWVEGFYFTTPLTDGKTDSKPEDGWFFLTGKTRHVISRNSCVYEVDPDTVGQFTGLTDKNGNRIFEGDILGGCNGSINGHEWEQKPILIKFSEGRFNVPLWAAKGEWDSTHYLVVIGNIHDNPELL